eukprot:TRINITY_DN7616_c0_g1_i3.p1 TRINITY_DN7616_c0_g1~~TRINITY_DN7616_c0_g1_i3.p1  ORF type:complete len:259 (-),score=58.64 TRINITY_DN7616_c0_g1_i3:512-1288(-)
MREYLRVGKPYSTLAALEDSAGSFSASFAAPTRAVVERVVLFRMREDFIEEQEADMLDNLYSLQYHYRGVVAISLGRIVSPRAQGFTHAFFSRFASREALAEFTALPALTSALEAFVLPFCEDMLTVDFEARVEDDIETIFRRGDFFETGVERLMLFRVKASPDEAPPEKVGEMLASLADLPVRVAPLIVQLTAGQNFSSSSQGYTHGMVLRAASGEDLEELREHPAYLEVLESQVLPLVDKVLVADYRVDTVSTKAA